MYECSLISFQPGHYHSENELRTMGILDVARIHMVVLAFLSGGLLVPISMFENTWNDLQGRGNSQTASGPAGKEPDKTD